MRQNDRYLQFGRITRQNKKLLLWRKIGHKKIHFDRSVGIPNFGIVIVT